MSCFKLGGLSYQFVGGNVNWSTKTCEVFYFVTPAIFPVVSRSGGMTDSSALTHFISYE
jgi:hypothetical protein